MVHAFVNSPPGELPPPPTGPESNGQDEPVDLATCVAAVQLRSPADLVLGSRQHSGQDSAEKVQPFAALLCADPKTVHRVDQAITALPAVGTEWLGFRLLAELGQGAFGRVYLAQQGDLANRSVVLKLSPNIDDESRTLAQLQHTNIVPVYSVHRAGAWQAVCMPYFGSTTLSNVLKEIKGRVSLPQSGKDLVSTIVNRVSTIRHRDTDSAVVASVSDRSEARAAPGADPAASSDSGVHGAPCVDATATVNLEVLQGFSYVEAVSVDRQSSCRRPGPRPRARHRASGSEAGQHPAYR